MRIEPAERVDDDATIEWFREYRRTRDRGLRNTLVEHYLELARALARRFANRNEPLDDLEQVAMLGVLKAVERFDPEYGTPFAAFAVPTVVGELRRHFRDHGWMVRVPRRIQNLHQHMGALVTEMAQRLERSPTVAELAEAAGVDVLFVPPAEEIYPPGFETWVDVERLGAMLEGEHRPGHFRGVATVCLKLFNLIRPRRAYFGQKDAQQVAVIRRMVRDLAVPVEIRVVPTVRDPDGLALSSRNAYLSPEERSQALALPRALASRDRSELDGLEVDYFEEADFEPRVLAAAVRVGSTRLIDNVVLEGDPS